jgi:DNA primase large subunit
VLINFLSNLKWTWEEIEELLARWNQKNRPGLAENYVTGQVRYARAKGKGVLPPNCSNQAYYKGYGVCSPDNTCQLIKNPVNYPMRLLKQKRGAKK